MKTRDEVETLKQQWGEDPCFDLEDAEGFEEWRAELLAYRQRTESFWERRSHERRSHERQSHERLSKRALDLGCSLELVAYLEQLEARIAKLEELDHV